MNSSIELIRLAAFAGFSLWTCSFVSAMVVGVFREGSSYLPTLFEGIKIYLSRGLGLIVAFAGVMWLLVEVIDFPVYLLSSVSYLQITLLTIFNGTTGSIISIFLQGLQRTYKSVLISGET